MSRGYQGYREDSSVSDTVFSEEESGYQDFYSPNNFSYNNVFSPNTSVTSLRDIYSPRNINASVTSLSDYNSSSRNINTSVTPLGDYNSPRNNSRELNSPTVSNYSTYSQEVKYIFDPNFGMQQRSRSHSSVKMQSTPSQFEPIDPSGNSTEDDYSQIQYPNRKPSVHRKASNSSQYSYKGQSQNVGQGQNGGQGHNGGQVYAKNPPPPPPRTSSSASASQISQQGDATLTPKKPSLTHSMSASYSAYYYPYNQTRRKTWSPEGFRQGYNMASIKRNHRLRSYSNEQLI